MIRDDLARRIAFVMLVGLGIVITLQLMGEGLSPCLSGILGWSVVIVVHGLVS